MVANHVRMSIDNKVQYCILPQWTLDYTFTQSGLYRLGSKSQPWIPRMVGEAHLHAPGCPYWENMSTLQSGHIIESAYIVFELNKLNIFSWEDTGSTLGNGPAPLRYMRFQDPSGRLGQSLKTLAYLGHERGDDAFWEAQAMLCQIIGLLLGSRALGPDERQIMESDSEANEMDFVRYVDTYLQQHLGETVTLETVARHLHVSPSTLSHRYRAETGRSPMATLAHRRIELAKLMLIKGHSLKIVADATGFCDAFHLSKTFKRLEGVSPRHFLTELQTRSRQPSSTNATPQVTGPLMRETFENGGEIL